MHLTIGVYANGEMIHNVIPNECLAHHIKYNLIFRPGRAFFVDGVCKNQGYLSFSEIEEWTEKIKNMEFDMSTPTIPYR